MAGFSSDGIQLGPDWFREDPEEAMYSGEANSLKVKEILHHQKSKYQDILVFDSVRFGRVLALDDIIQLTEKDEFVYHEMMSHVSLFSHPWPKSVLIIGGGDGGMLREAAKHPMVEEIHLCEIDEEVISVSKKYFKSLAVGFTSPKVKIFLRDGVEFVRQSNSRYDLIITDCSELGPAEVLYQEDYFKLVHKALRPGGIMSLQGQCLWQQDDMMRIKEVIQTSKNIFAVTDYASVAIPSFDTVGMVLNGKDESINFCNPVRIITEEEADKFKLQFYDYETHKAAFVLPRFIRKQLQLHYPSPL